jgi:peptide/nickel transport system permease protein
VGRGLLQRLAQGLLVAALAASATFLALALAPGDPFATVLDASQVDDATRERWRAQWALDRPVPVRLLAWGGGLLRLDPGPSVALGRPILAAIGDALPYTLLLMGTAVLGALLLGVGVALVQARSRGGLGDRLLGGLTLLGVAVPEAALGLLLIGVVAVDGGWLPAGGAHALDAAGWPLAWRLRDLAEHLVLPVVTLAVGGAAMVARHQRAALLAAADDPAVWLWRARGLAEGPLWRTVILRHALAPLVTLLGLAFPALIGGAVIVERLFAWPGMGTLLMVGVARRDAPLVATGVALTAVAVVLGSLLADALQRRLDPRLRP